MVAELAAGGETDMLRLPTRGRLLIPPLDYCKKQSTENKPVYDRAGQIIVAQHSSN